MSEPAEDRFAALEAELAQTREKLDAAAEKLDVATEQLARIEPLLRVLLKRAPRRAEAASRPDASANVLTDEQRAAVRRRFKASQARKKT